MKTLFVCWGIAVCLLFCRCEISLEPDRHYLEFIPSYYDLTNSHLEFLSEGRDSAGSTAYYFTNNDSFLITISKTNVGRRRSDFSDPELVFSLPSSYKEILYPTLSPTGRFLLFSTHSAGPFDLFKVDLYTGELIRLTETPFVHERFPCFSIDGRKVVYSAQGTSVLDEALVVLDLEIFEKDTLVLKASEPSSLPSLRYPHFVGNDKILFIESKLTSDSIITMNLDGRNRIMLDSGRFGFEKPAVSRDGSRIVYRKEDNRSDTIISIKTDGPGFLNIVESVSNEAGFSLSEDGEIIVYWIVDPATNGFDNGELTIMYAMNTDGTNRRRLAQGRDASFSNDGSKLIFTALRQRQYDN